MEQQHCISKRQPTINELLMKRRDFIATTSITTLGFMALSRCAMNMEDDLPPSLDLVADPDGYLDLPNGFSYKIISKAGDSMSDGLIVPGRPDGMGT